MKLPCFRCSANSASPPSSPSARVASSSAKNVIKTTLIFLEKAAEAAGIPLVRGSVGVIIEIVKIAEKHSQNKESLDELVKYLRRLEEAIIMPVLNKKGRGAPELDARIRRLTEELVSLANEWKLLRESHKRFLSFVDHEDYTREISRLNAMINESLAAFSLENQIATAAIIETIHDTVTQHILSKEIQTLRRAHASYNSTSRSNAPRCFRGTRVSIFKMLRKWILDSDASRICILEGIAGVGKTTIAQTLAEEQANLQRLAASFMFSRDESDRNSAELFFTTIAYQLGQCHKDFADRISQALHQSPDAPYKTFTEQLKILIADPLRELPISTSYPNLIILDAMDECESEGAVQILELLLDYLPSFKILITTRPEPHLRAIFDRHKALESLVLHEVDNMVVDSDIRMYLEHQLSEEEVQKAVPGCEWCLKKEDLDTLVGASGRLFIVASTAEKFIKHQIQGDPQHQLRVLLGAFGKEEIEEDGDLSPHTVLDHLYNQVLSTAIPPSGSSRNIIERFQLVVGTIIVLQNPLLPQPLAALIGLTASSVNAALRRLQSVIVSNSKDQCPRVYHPSFPDFITNPARCKDTRFLIDPGRHHGRMASHCLDTMKQTLKRNICDIPLPEQYLENSKIPGLSEKVAENISATLVYACSHWAVHLSKAQYEIGQLLDELEEFVFHHLLYWLEVLSLIGNLKSGYHALVLAYEFAVLHGGSRKLLAMLNDGQRFVMASQTIIKASAFHIYYSALPFTPSQTTLYQTYKSETSSSIKVLRGQTTRWDPLLAVLAGHRSFVRCVGFTSDGKRLASGSNDATIKLWDGVTGADLTTLKGHTSRVVCLAFASDGKRLASGSGDTTVRLWDGATGALCHTLEGHEGGVWSVAFSPDGKRLASGSGDGTIRMWDRATGAHLATLVGHPEGVNAVAFTPDGKRLVSGSDDRTVRMWEVATGVQAMTLEGHSDYVLCVAFTSDGKRLATGAGDHTIRWWDSETGEHIATLEGHTNNVWCLAIASGGVHLATGSADKTVKLWDLRTWSCVASLEGHTGEINSLAFSPDGNRLVSASDDKTIRAWDMAIYAHSTPEPRSRPLPDEVQPTPQTVDKIPAINHPPARSGTTSSQPARVICFTFTPDHKRLAAGSADGVIHLWNLATKAGPITLTGHTGMVNCITFSPDGASFVSGSDDTTIKLWDSVTGAHLATLEGHSDWVMSVHFIANGTRLISHSDDGEIKEWDVATKAEIAGPEDKSIYLYHLLFPSSSPSVLPPPHELKIKDRGGFVTVIADPGPGGTSIPICLLPLGLVTRTWTAAQTHLAFQVENGQVFIVDTSQVRPQG